MCLAACAALHESQQHELYKLTSICLSTDPSSLTKSIIASHNQAHGHKTPSAVGAPATPRSERVVMGLFYSFQQLEDGLAQPEKFPLKVWNLSYSEFSERCNWPLCLTAQRTVRPQHTYTSDCFWSVAAQAAKQ